MLETPDGQKVAEFGSGNNKVLVGGDKGEYPLVLIGSIFYTGHKIVKDERTGEMDKAKAEEEINGFLEFSDKTGIPVIIDVVSSYKEPLVKRCEFIADYTDVPFLVDGMRDEDRIYAMKHMAELGLLNRAVYNSIDENTKEDDLKQIKELGVKNSVLLCFGSRAVTPKNKIKMLNGTPGKRMGLIEKAKIAGIENFIVDTAVLDVPSIAIAGATVKKVKEELKLPVGCAPVNAIAEWRNRKMFGKPGLIVNNATIVSYIAEAGANFVMYGSINKAANVFPGMAMIDSINSYYRKRILRKETHPSKFYEFLG